MILSSLFTRNLVFLASFSMILVFAKAANASLPDGIYEIQQSSSQRYLDAALNENNDFEAVTRGRQENTSQHWRVKRVGDSYSVQQVVNDRFLDAHESDTYRVVTRTDQQNNTQRWIITPVADVSDLYTVQQASNNRFLDAFEGSNNGFRVVTRDPQNNASQQWKFTPVAWPDLPEDAIYNLQQVSTNRYLDAHGGSNNDFSAVTRTAQHNDTQRWRLTREGEHFHIQQLSTYRYLDAYEGRGTRDEWDAVVRMHQGDDSQLWKLTLRDQNRGIYTIQQVLNNRFLDAWNDSVSGKDWTAVTRPAQNDTSQQWKLTLVRRLPTGSAINEFEKSVAVKNVASLVDKVNARETIDVESEISGFEDAYYPGKEVGKMDHISGITMTSRGRVVMAMSRADGDDVKHCGVLIYSDPVEDLNVGDLTWNMECVLRSHPSGMQAVGEIVAIPSKEGKNGSNHTQFFMLPTDGEPFKELTHLRREQGTHEAVGVAYHPGEDRFYMFTALGAVTPKAAQSIEICRTDPGKSLIEPGTTWGECKDIDAVWVADQGSHLIVDDAGKMFVVSSFSSHNKIEDVSDGLECTLGTIGRNSVSYRDIVSVSQIEYDAGAAFTVLKPKDIGITQVHQCVNTRPAFRFGGAVAATNGGLIALWAGRFNLVFQLFSDDIEFSYQEVNE